MLKGYNFEGEKVDIKQEDFILNLIEVIKEINETLVTESKGFVGLNIRMQDLDTLEILLDVKYDERNPQMVMFNVTKTKITYGDVVSYWDEEIDTLKSVISEYFEREDIKILVQNVIIECKSLLKKHEEAQEKEEADA